MTEGGSAGNGQESGGPAAPRHGHWPRGPRGPRWGGFALAAGAALAGSLAMVALHQPNHDGARYVGVEAPARTAPTHQDPLMATLIRCRALPAQADDPACRTAWDENARRFFGETRAMRVPGDPLPTYAPIPVPAARAVPATRVVPATRAVPAALTERAALARPGLARPAPARPARG